MVNNERQNRTECCRGLKKTAWFPVEGPTGDLQDNGYVCVVPLVISPFVLVRLKELRMPQVVGLLTGGIFNF